MWLSKMYHITAERSFNSIHFQRVNHFDIRWNSHLPPAKHPTLKMDSTKLSDEYQITAKSIGAAWSE